MPSVLGSNAQHIIFETPNSALSALNSNVLSCEKPTTILQFSAFLVYYRGLSAYKSIKNFVKRS